MEKMGFDLLILKNIEKNFNFYKLILYSFI